MLVYLFNLAVVLFAAILASALLTAAIFGVMFAVHKFAADKFREHSYENFDFNNITKPALSEFILRLAAVIFPATVVLVLLVNILFPPLSPQGFRQHYLLVSVILWFLETAAIAVGLVFLCIFYRPELLGQLLGAIALALLIVAAFVSPVKRALADASFSMFGVLYTGLTLATIPLLSAQENGPSLFYTLRVY